MYAEAEYEYKPLIGSSFLKSRRIRHETALMCVAHRFLDLRRGRRHAD